QVLVAGLLHKDIETYGVIKITEAGEEFLNQPTSFMMTEDHQYTAEADGIIGAAKSGAVADPKLMKMLKDLRKKVAKKKDLHLYVIFQDPSLEDMALKYPITLKELRNIHGVGKGKAKKFGQPFIEFIQQY